MADHHVPPLKVGDFVRICRGPYTGLTGRVCRIRPNLDCCFVQHDRLDPPGWNNLGEWAFSDLEREDA